MLKNDRKKKPPTFLLGTSSPPKKQKLDAEKRKSIVAMRCVPRPSEKRDFSYTRIRDTDDSRSIVAAEETVEGLRESIESVDRSNPSTKMTFTREMLKNVQVIGQFDKKFIICRMRYEKDGEESTLITAFDQHAVHERIRLEYLYKENRITKSSKLAPSIKTTLASMACKSAVRFGDRMSKSKCEILINGLRDCLHPFQCAHGRPSIVPLVKMPGSYFDAQKGNDDDDVSTSNRPKKTRDVIID